MSPSACLDTLSDAIFCDGFEDGPGFAAWTSGPHATDGLVSWSDVTPYRGRGALRAELTATSGGYARVETATSPIVNSGSYWLRFFVRYPASSPLDHFDIAALVNSSNGVGVTFYVENSQPTVWFSETSSYYTINTPVDRDRWTCVELHLAVSDTAGAFDLYIDGTPVRSVAGRDTLPGLGYDGLAIGITASETFQTPTAVEIDEVAVGIARLPCN
jgi:hypothetical protein